MEFVDSVGFFIIIIYVYGMSRGQDIVFILVFCMSNMVGYWFFDGIIG